MKYIKEIQKVFEKQRDINLAKGMEKYMKDKFPYLGIKAPLRNEISRPFYAEIKKWDLVDFKIIILELWELPEREYQYLACELLKKNSKKLEKKDLPFLKELITTKSWWDTVDLLASNPLGELLQKYPEQKTEMDKWIKDRDMWVRRSALLYQLKYKKATNQDKLFEYCLLRSGEKEFFIRKAIGWALRQYAKCNSKAVQGFVLQHENQLSNLSKKEALKNIS